MTDPAAPQDPAERVLLVVHHTPSPTTRELLEAVLAGANDPEITGVRVRSVPALGATVPDVLAADGYVFGTSANFGYMSGTLAVTSVQKIVTGLELTQAAAVVEVTGPIDAAVREKCYELGATVAVTVAGEL